MTKVPPARQGVAVEPRRHVPIVPVVLTALLIVLLPLVSNSYVLSLLVMAGIYAILATGLDLFMGQTGQVSFGHNAFAALGGYASAILTTSHGWPPLLAVVVSIAVSVAVAAFIGLRTLRLRGHYLAMATLALGMIVYTLTVQLTSLTNGFAGIAAIPPMGIGPVEVSSDLQYYYLIWSLAALGMWISFRIKYSRVGRALGAIAGNEEAASALGIDIARLKLMAFALSAAYASVSGSLMAHYISFLSPEIFGLDMVTLLFAMLFVGGIGTVYGPVIGAIMIILLPAILGNLADYRQLAYGIILLLMIMFAPQGVFALLSDLGAKLRNRDISGRGRHGS